MAKKLYGVELPSTLERSSARAQRTYAATLTSAEKQYGKGERASRTAFGALKHGFERVGNRWIAKKHRGPSDPQDALTGKAARDRNAETFGGVDYFGHTKRELYERARALDVPGRSTMDKKDLARAIARKQR